MAGAAAGSITSQLKGIPIPGKGPSAREVAPLWHPVNVFLGASLRDVRRSYVSTSSEAQLPGTFSDYLRHRLDIDEEKLWTLVWGNKTPKFFLGKKIDQGQDQEVARRALFDFFVEISEKIKYLFLTLVGAGQQSVQDARQDYLWFLLAYQSISAMASKKAQGNLTKKDVFMQALELDSSSREAFVNSVARKFASFDAADRGSDSETGHVFIELLTIGLTLREHQETLLDWEQLFCIAELTTLFSMDSVAAFKYFQSQPPKGLSENNERIVNAWIQGATNSLTFNGRFKGDAESETETETETKSADRAATSGSGDSSIQTAIDTWHSNCYRLLRELARLLSSSSFKGTVSSRYPLLPYQFLQVFAVGFRGLGESLFNYSQVATLAPDHAVDETSDDLNRPLLAGGEQESARMMELELLVNQYVDACQDPKVIPTVSARLKMRAPVSSREAFRWYLDPTMNVATQSQEKASCEYWVDPVLQELIEKNQRDGAPDMPQQPPAADWQIVDLGADTSPDTRATGHVADGTLYTSSYFVNLLARYQQAFSTQLNTQKICQSKDHAVSHLQGLLNDTRFRIVDRNAALLNLVRDNIVEGISEKELKGGKITDVAKAVASVLGTSTVARQEWRKFVSHFVGSRAAVIEPLYQGMLERVLKVLGMVSPDAITATADKYDGVPHLSNLVMAQAGRLPKEAFSRELIAVPSEAFLKALANSLIIRSHKTENLQEWLNTTLSTLNLMAAYAVNSKVAHIAVKAMLQFVLQDPRMMTNLVINAAREYKAGDEVESKWVSIVYEAPMINYCIEALHQQAFLQVTKSVHGVLCCRGTPAPWATRFELNRGVYLLLLALLLGVAAFLIIGFLTGTNPGSFALREASAFQFLPAALVPGGLAFYQHTRRASLATFMRYFNSLQGQEKSAFLQYCGNFLRGVGIVVPPLVYAASMAVGSGAIPRAFASEFFLEAFEEGSFVGALIDFISAITTGTVSLPLLSRAIAEFQAQRVVAGSEGPRVEEANADNRDQELAAVTDQSGPETVEGNGYATLIRGLTTTTDQAKIREWANNHAP